MIAHHDRAEKHEMNTVGKLVAIVTPGRPVLQSRLPLRAVGKSTVHDRSGRIARMLRHHHGRWVLLPASPEGMVAALSCVATMGMDEQMPGLSSTHPFTHGSHASQNAADTASCYTQGVGIPIPTP